jgi:hypothetical protein
MFDKNQHPGRLYKIKLDLFKIYDWFKHQNDPKVKECEYYYEHTNPNCDFILDQDNPYNMEPYCPKCFGLLKRRIKKRKNHE